MDAQPFDGHCCSSYCERSATKDGKRRRMHRLVPSLLKELEQCHAVAGRAEDAHSSGNGYRQVEWFEIKCTNRVTKERVHYCEQRQVSFENSSSALGVPWRKSLRSKDKYYISNGPRTKPMEKFELLFLIRMVSSSQVFGSPRRTKCTWHGNDDWFRN